MSKIIFSQNELIKLRQNPNVQRVSERAITYTNEFKMKFIDAYAAGHLPRQIFEDNGFDISVLGIKRIEQSAYRWKKLYIKEGVIGLSDSRKCTSGRHQKGECSPRDIIRKQEARIEVLEEQIRMLRSYISKHVQTKNKYYVKS